MPLSIHHTPLCVTFAYLEKYVCSPQSPYLTTSTDDSRLLALRHSNLLLLDPTSQETQVSTGTLTLTLNAQRELCVLSKAGGTPLGVDELMKVVTIGVSVVREMTAEIEAALKADEGVRVIEVR